MKKINLTLAAVAAAFFMALTGCSKTAETSCVTSLDTTAETSASEEISEVQKIAVYSAAEDKGEEGTYVTPGVKLGDSDLTDVNSEISKFITDVKENSEWFCGTEYSYYDGGDYISLLVRGISTIDCDSYKAFNISAKTGKLMTDNEFLTAVGKDSDAFAELVKKTVSDAMEDDKEGSLFTVIEGTDYKAENLKDSNLTKAMPYVSDRGNLCFIYDLQMYVGADEYTVCLDTVTHEHMLNDFGHWTLYPEWG